MVNHLSFIQTSLLGLAQIFVWGGSFFLMAVLADPVIQDTGWSRQWVYGALSLSLLVAGLTAPYVGRHIVHHGGRKLLAASGIITALGLMIVGLASSLPMFLFAWALLGLAMAIGLYDPLFATLGTLYGEQARRAITQVTLISGFSTTITWPLMAGLIEHLGWRYACWAYALLLAVLIWPLYSFGLPEPKKQKSATETVQKLIKHSESTPDRTVLALVMLGFTLAAIIHTAISVHLVAILQATGLSISAAIAISALIGPSQVGARAINTLFDRWHPIWNTLGSATMIALGLTLVLFPAATVVGMVLYGAGSGIRSIVRGTLPLALFGSKDYALILGKIARPVMIAQALTPLLGGYLLEHQGAQASLISLCILAALNIASIVVLIFYLKTQSRKNC